MYSQSDITYLSKDHEGLNGSQPEQKKKILVVEDDIDIQKLIRHIMEKNNFHIDIASNGLEGVEVYMKNAVLQKPHDLILMDFFMPVMDGLNATRVIRESRGQLPIIMLTANNDTKGHAAAIAAGCSELMMKPFQIKSLLQRVEFWLRCDNGVVLNQVR